MTSIICKLIAMYDRFNLGYVEMDVKNPYIIAIIIEVTYAVMFVVNKAALDHGMNTYVFIFYRQAAASLLVLPVAIFLERTNVRSMSFVLLSKLFFCALIGITATFNLYNVSLKLTSATVSAATTNSIPVLTFCVALLLRMEEVKLRSPTGIAKVTGVALCLAGVFVIAFYAGPSLSPVNHRHPFGAATAAIAVTVTQEEWIKGMFMAVLAVVAWSVWIVLQAILLREFPNKMLVTVAQCLFSTVQCFVVAAVAERDFSMWKLHLDVGLLAIAYSGFVVFGVSYYLQALCLELKGPVFVSAWAPLGFVLTMFLSSFFLGEIVHLGSILGGLLLCGGLYGVLWAKSNETKMDPCSKEVDETNGSQDEIVHKEHEVKTKKEKAGEEEEATSATTAEHV